MEIKEVNTDPKLYINCQNTLEKKNFFLNPVRGPKMNLIQNSLRIVS